MGSPLRADDRISEEEYLPGEIGHNRIAGNILAAIDERTGIRI